MSLWIPSVLTIAGSDSGGGAGIQADLKTITSLGLYGSSVITAVTAQNTAGVQMIEPVSEELLRAQLDSVLSDLPPQAVKIGMTGTSSAVLTIAEKLRNAPSVPIVLDPVMISTSGRRLLDESAVSAMINTLFPLASLITPNIPEAEFLLRLKGILNKDDMEKAASALSLSYKIPVLLKGGHLAGTADDVLCCGQSFIWYNSCRIETSNSHGTGCTLSSAIACGLASGKSLKESIMDAKTYLTGALSAGLDLGSGNGPLYHSWNLKL